MLIIMIYPILAQRPYANSADPDQTPSDQGLQYLLTEIFIKNTIKNVHLSPLNLITIDKSIRQIWVKHENKIMRLTK